MRRRCVLLGGGGHAKVLIDALLADDQVDIVGILERSPFPQGRAVLGIPVVGTDAKLEELVRDGVSGFIVGVGSARDNRPRQRLFEIAASHGLEPVTVRHATSIVSTFAHVGRGAQLLARSVVNADAVLGENVIVNTGAIVEHDCRIGSHVHVATGAQLASGVAVGVGTHVGAGATVKEGVVIGEYAVVGAGAVVISDVEAGTVVVGVPARLLRNPSQ